MLTPRPKPDYVTALEAIYGPPSQAGFGSAVFCVRTDTPGGLEQAARSAYQHFVGELWNRYGSATWLGSWQEVYTRSPGVNHTVVAELRALKNREAAQSAALILDEAGDPQAAQSALAAVFDAPAVTELAVYKIGDGAALSGILVAENRAASHETIMLVFLLD